MPPYIAPEVKQRLGVWGAPTSTLDWCEENHVVTLFVAELWNTISNIWFFLLPCVGLWYGFKYKVERRYILCYVGMIGKFEMWISLSSVQADLLVGVGSALFHATLKLSMQLLDELPMLVLSAFMLFTLQEMGEVRGQYTSWTYIRTLFVVTYTTVVSLVYVIVNDPTFHEIAYALMVLVITYLGFKNLGKYGKWKSLWFALLSLLSYALAFVLWNIDNHFCPSLRSFRSTHSSALGLGTLTQFHAWWHFLACTGTYMHLVLSSKLRMEYLGHPSTIKTIVGIPYLEVQLGRP